MAAEVTEEDKYTKKMKVFFAVPKPPRSHHRRHDPIVLEVSRDDTVASVKATLHGMKGIPPGRQRLVFARSALLDDDDTTLGDHGVVDSSTIQLVETKMQVFVRCMHDGTGRTIALLDVESSDTVESFRIKLQERIKTMLRPAQMWLSIYGYHQLEDGHTLADYGVQNCTKLTLIARSVRMRQRNLELNIEVTDTVGRIKERVEEAEGVPVPCQSVYYHGKELHDDRALADDNGHTIEWVNIECRRQVKGDAINTSNKGVVPMVIDTETVKRRADLEVTSPRKKIKKMEKIKKKSLPEAVKTLQVVRRRRFRVHLIGPELAAICPSSCDSDPEY